MTTRELKTRVKSRDLDALASYRDYLCANPRLTYLFLELTDACNLSCLHCGSPRIGEQANMMTTSNALAAIDSVASSFPRESVMLCMTGGEPMLHADLLSIASAAHDRDIPWGMTTNGTLIDRAVADDLVSAGLATVSVSLDGMGAEHDWLRRQAGCFERAVRGIEALRDVGVPVQVTTVVHSHNISQLEEMHAFVRTLGVVSWRVVNIEPIGRALTHPELLLGAREMSRLLEFVRRARYTSREMEVCYGCSHFLSLELEHEVRDNYFLCGAGIYVASILCNGDIYGCLDIERRPELVQGNIGVDDLAEVWRNGFAWFRSDKSLACMECQGCADRRYCVGDSTHTWDFERGRPRFCHRRDLDNGRMHDDVR